MNREHVLGGATWAPATTLGASRTLRATTKPPGRAPLVDTAQQCFGPRYGTGPTRTRGRPPTTEFGAPVPEPKPLPSLIQIGDLPGPLSLSLLVNEGIVTCLDRSCCYLNDQAEGLYGRASIVMSMVPYGAAACGGLALWVWINGHFPDALDIISNSHFRTPVYGRPLRPHQRQLDARYLMKLGQLWVTSPLWTACDLACEPTGQCNGEDIMAVLHELMERYHVSCGSCEALLSSNPRWPGHAQGLDTIRRLKAIL